ISRYDVLILFEDFNAKIGREDFLQHVAGKHSLHDNTNTNGKTLSQLTESNELIIKSTCLEKKKHIKEHGKCRVINQIDYVLISRRQESSIIDVGSARGPNCDSDHYVVRAKFKERMARAECAQGPRKHI
ncbi:Craniofacial development protein 2, partial [Camponotus floridanus]